MADGLRPYGVLGTCFDLDGSWRHEPGDMRCGRCGWEPETPMANVSLPAAVGETLPHLRRREADRRYVALTFRADKEE